MLLLLFVPPYFRRFVVLTLGSTILATNTIGNRMLIRHGQNGWLVDETPEAVSAGIQHMLASPDLRQCLAQHARPSVERYDWGCIVAEKLVPVYHELICQTASGFATGSTDLGE